MKTVLLVDDSRTMQLSMRQLFTGAGYSVQTAEDGEAAMGHIKGGLRPDLIITDINMPRMNGLEFIKAARTVVRFAPILALTTESQQSRKDEAKQAGATGWVLKPVDGNDLLKVARRLMPA